MASYLLTLGDSVPWGQGLLPAHKYSRIVADALRVVYPDLVEHLPAHSGALIGAGLTVTRTPVNGEVPVGYPTVFEQLAAFPGDPHDAKVVLVNGGLNDVDFRTILNPFIPSATLRALTIEHCYDSMRQLLSAIVTRFPSASTEIVLTSYYPILSTKSTPFRIPRLLIVFGLQSAAVELITHDSLYELIIQRCLQFWTESTDQLRRAVEEVNTAIGQARIKFVDPGFKEANAVFTDDPWLWGLNQNLSPQDEVIDPRHGACNAAIPWIDVLAREQCYRASAGHPNVKGAQKYADAIRAALGLV